MDTLFTKIIKGELPSKKIYEDKDVVAILDLHPVHPGHTLVIPKHPYKNLYEIPETTLGSLMTVVQHVAQKIKQELGADGINIMMNNEPAAGQIIMHAHIHVIPRYTNDGLKHWESISYKENEMDEIAEKLKL